MLCISIIYLLNGMYPPIGYGSQLTIRCYMARWLVQSMRSDRRDYGQ